MDKFQIISDIDLFSTFNIKDKILFLKQLANVMSYNKDYQTLPIDRHMFENLLKDLINSKDQASVNRDYLILARLFFMCINNSIVDNTKAQRSYFNILFIENFNDFETVSLHFVKDLKINKFFLSIFYNIIFINDDNLKKLNRSILILLHAFLRNYVDENKLNDNEIADNKEINQWKYIIFKYIIKSNEMLLDNKNCLECYLNSFLKVIDNISLVIKHQFTEDQIIIFEFIRDCLELKKDSSEIEINDNNIKLISEIFLKNLENLYSIIENFKQNYFQDFLKYEMDSNNDISINFKLFLCLVDVLSILLPIKEYRQHLFKRFNLEFVLDLCHNILLITDEFYDVTFKRNKIKENTEGAPENNVFYCFQTNIFKFLANYYFSNLEAKKYYLEQKNSLRFYYLLNHMKIDKSNPFKKEWTVLLVKALCENCNQIQNKIMELKANDIDPFLKEYLLKNNYDIKLDKDNYKVEINKKE